MESVNTTFLPLSDPLCANETCLAFAAAADASQAQISWLSQFAYGRWVTYYYCGIIGVFALVYTRHAVSDRFVYKHDRNTRTKAPTLGDKLLAVGRYLSYRRLRGHMGNTLALPSLGVGALIVLSMLYALLLAFVQRPYYRERRDYGSPPLGIRAGMAATALTPLVFALAGKNNLITLLIGISHEKLNVFHRWVSYIYLFFGVVHTIPFIVAALKDGGSERLHYQFTYDGSMEYTGIAPFAVLVFLCVASAYPLRRYFYSLFAKSHILGSLAFLGTMFWHCENLIDSWYYLWATLAVMLLQWTIRAFSNTTFFEMSGDVGGWKRAGEVSLEVLEGDMCRVKMHVTMSWLPGQHVFLRIPELGMFANHPFTIASACPAQLESETRSEKHQSIDSNELVLLIRPYRGLTKKLINHNGASLYGMIDGPYGGISRQVHMAYDNVILVGGGGGVSALLPWLDDLSMKMQQYSRDGTVRIAHLSLVWCIREASALTWIRDVLDRYMERLPASALSINVYITGGGLDAENAISASPPRQASSVETATVPRVTDGTAKETTVQITERPALIIHAQRPFMPDILTDGIRAGRSLYIGCGPESMKTDLSNFVADAQKRVLKGTCAEVALHTETFDW